MIINNNGHNFINKTTSIYNKFKKEEYNINRTICSTCGYSIDDDINFVIEFGIEFYIRHDVHKNYVSCNEQIIKNLLE